MRFSGSDFRVRVRVRSRTGFFFLGFGRSNLAMYAPRVISLRGCRVSVGLSVRVLER